MLDKKDAKDGWMEYNNRLRGRVRGTSFASRRGDMYRMNVMNGMNEDMSASSLAKKCSLWTRKEEKKNLPMGHFWLNGELEEQQAKEERFADVVK